MKCRFFCLTIVFSLLLLSCNKCDNTIIGSITGEGGGMSGKWKLTQVKSPKKNQTLFPYKEVLQLTWASTTNTTNYNEVTLRDSIRVSSFDFVDSKGNCDDNSVVVSYSNGFQRKYWLIENGQLEATDHVNQIGGTSDTLRYFYTKIQ